jgi:hypothetical protein
MAFTEVSGTVTRTFFNGKGAEVVESFTKKDGSEGKSRYSLWFAAEHGLREGDTGKWRGALSVAVDEWVDKESVTRHSAKVSLNGTKSIGDRAASGAGTPSTGAPARQDAAQEEPWAATPPVASTGYTDDLPF